MSVSKKQNKQNQLIKIRQYIGVTDSFIDNSKKNLLKLINNGINYMLIKNDDLGKLHYIKEFDKNVNIVGMLSDDITLLISEEIDNEIVYWILNYNYFQSLIGRNKTLTKFKFDKTNNTYIKGDIKVILYNENDFKLK